MTEGSTPRDVIKDAIARGRRIRQARQRRLAVFGVLLLLAVAAGGTAWANGRGRTNTSLSVGPVTNAPSPDMTAGETPSTAASRPPEILPAPPRVLLAGVSGADGYELTVVSLMLTSDSAQTWTADALPRGLRPSAITVISVAPGQPTLLLLAATKIVTVYRQVKVGGPWTVSSIAADFTGFPDAAVSNLAIDRQTGSFVALAAEYGLGNASASLDLFTSVDGGKQFRALPSQSVAYWNSFAFGSATTGIATGGGTGLPYLVSYTRDGGATYSTSATPYTGERGVLLTPTMYDLSFPNSVGSDLSAYRTDPASHITTVTQLTSSDGASFHLVRGTPLVIPAANEPGLDGETSYGSATNGVLWIFGSDHMLYTSNDDGGHWSAISSPSLPQGVGGPNSIAMTSPSAATVVGDAPGCTDASSCTEIYRTTDGGHTWSAAPPG